MREYLRYLAVTVISTSLLMVGACNEGDGDDGGSAGTGGNAATGTASESGGAATPTPEGANGVGGGLHAPNIISPASGAIYYGSTLLPVVHMEWEAVPNAVLYRLRIDYQSDWSAPLLQDIDVNTSGTTYEFNSGTDGHGYGMYWLTIAVDGPGGDHVNGQQYQPFEVKVRE